MSIFLLLLLSAIKVESINIDGNEYFSDGALKSIMLTKIPNLFRKGHFLSEIFKGDLTAIHNYYDYHGFLETKIEHELSFDSAQKKVTIQIDIHEGNQTFIENITFTGNTLFKNDFLNEKITMRSEEFFDQRKIETDAYIITSLYDDAGYANIQVQFEHEIQDHKARIFHHMIEGEKQFVQNTEFVGLKYTKHGVIAREINVKPNDVFRYADILKSQRNLYNLGIFQSIRIQTQNAPASNYKIVQFILTEKDPMSINFRIGYGTQDRLRLGAGITHRNIWGRAWHGEFQGKVSFAEFRLSSHLTFPRFLIFPNKTTVGAFFQSKKDIGYKTQSISGYSNLPFNLAKGKLSTKYSIENIRTYYTDADSVEHDWLHGVTINWLKDGRNDPFFVRKGNYVNINLETSGIIIPSDVNYVRPTFVYNFFKPMAIFVLASSFRTGFVQAVAPTSEVPVYVKFHCGGTSSVRGYSEQSIGPMDENENPMRGKILLELSQEIRFPIYKLLGGTFFIDAGNIWQEYDDINRHLRWGIGAGLRLFTPIGSVRLDYGFKLGRQPDEPIGALHFAIGEAF